MQQLKDFLDSMVAKYNHLGFIENDPISIPHKFSAKEDIEISGFFSAIIAWGNRKSIIKSANQLMHWFDNAPYDFIMNHSQDDLKPFDQFVYRTFNGIDCTFFIKTIQNIYLNHGGLEKVFVRGYSKNKNIAEAIIYFRSVFFSINHENRTQKHIANPFKGSSAKRLNMFLRWMIRHDAAEVDFGIWKNINPAHLMIPLDIHSGSIARGLGILKRKQNDWKAVEELTQVLQTFDKTDPVKYDYALFGLGVNKDFNYGK